MCYIGSELWESKFDELLSLVKEYIIDVWEIRKHKLYDSDGKFSQNGKFGQNGKLGHSCTNVTKRKLYGSRDSDHAIVHLGLNVSIIVGAWSMVVMLWQYIYIYNILYIYIYIIYTVTESIYIYNISFRSPPSPPWTPAFKRGQRLIEAGVYLILARTVLALNLLMT